MLLVYAVRSIYIIKCTVGLEIPSDHFSHYPYIEVCTLSRSHYASIHIRAHCNVLPTHKIQIYYEGSSTVGISKSSGYNMSQRNFKSSNLNLKSSLCNYHMYTAIYHSTVEGSGIFSDRISSIFRCKTRCVRTHSIVTYQDLLQMPGLLSMWETWPWTPLTWQSPINI